MEAKAHDAFRQNFSRISEALRHIKFPVSAPAVGVTIRAPFIADIFGPPATRGRGTLPNPGIPAHAG